MDAVPAITLSLIAVVPGLMLYCAIYDVFCRRNNAISTVPRDPKSVEALTVILMGALAVHLVAVSIASLFEWPCAFALCRSMTPIGGSGEMLLLDLATGRTPGRDDLAAIGATTFALSAITYAVVDGVMRRLASREALPFWLYRWTATVAVSNDKAAIMLAYVLTTIEIDDKRVLYLGPVDDLALDDKFDVQRVVLVEAQRFVVDLEQQGLLASGPVLGTVPKIVLHKADIANVVFERSDLAVIAATAQSALDGAPGLATAGDAP